MLWKTMWQLIPNKQPSTETTSASEPLKGNNTLQTVETKTSSCTFQDEINWYSSGAGCLRRSCPSRWTTEETCQPALGECLSSRDNWRRGPLCLSSAKVSIRFVHSEPYFVPFLRLVCGIPHCRQLPNLDNRWTKPPVISRAVVRKFNGMSIISSFSEGKRFRSEFDRLNRCEFL